MRVRLLLTTVLAVVCSVAGVASCALAAPARGAAAGRQPQALALAPRAAATAATGTSVAAVADYFGNQYVVWKGQDANLWYTAYDASTHTWTAPAVVAGAGPLGSEPTVTLDYGVSAAYLFVFWQGNDGNLWMATGTIPDISGAPTTIAWNSPSAVPGMGPLGSAPSATYIYQVLIGRLRVYWKGSDGNLWGADGNVDNSSGAVTWTGPTVVPGMAPLGSAPTAGADDNGDIYVFWQGAGNNTHVWEAWYNNQAATPAWSTSPIDLGQFSGNTSSPPSVAVTYSGQQYVFWTGQDGNLWFAEWTGSGWLNNSFNYIGEGPLGSAPAATVSSASAVGVYWKGTDANLWTTTSPTPGFAWTGPTSLGDGPLDG